MYEINIIREKIILIKAKKKFLHYLRIAGAAGLLILAGLIYKSYMSSVKISEYKKEKAMVNAEINRMIERFNINKYRKEWTKYYQQVYQIKEIFSEKTFYAVRLQELAMLCPAEMCITRIKIDKNKETINLEIVMLADKKHDFEQFKEFVNKIEKSPFFSHGVKLITQKRSKVKSKLKEKAAKLFIVSIPIKEDLKYEETRD